MDATASFYFYKDYKAIMREMIYVLGEATTVKKRVQKVRFQNEQRTS